MTSDHHPGRLQLRLAETTARVSLRLRRRLQRCAWALNSRSIPVERILLSGENGMSAAHYARVTGHLRRASIPMIDSPHARFLRDYQRLGRSILDPPALEKTDYFRNACECIDLTGFYFDAKTPGEVGRVAARFLDRFDGRDHDLVEPIVGQSARRSPIFVRRIRHSRCVQLVDGAHRVAIACARGKASVRAAVIPPRVSTPMQDMLLDVLWLKGKRELYQPVDLPEVAEWTLVRKCTDRFAKMRAFLEAENLLPPDTTSYLDVASSYGWFVDQMGSLGYAAHGVERDPIAASLGQHLYGLKPTQIQRADCVDFLRSYPHAFDVTSCFSLAHHFVLGRAAVSAEELLQLLDSKTRRVLFFDTGQAHEAWFRPKLESWTADFIEQWLLRHSTFSRVCRLGVDEDAVPPFAANYSRMLFACVR